MKILNITDIFNHDNRRITMESILWIFQVLIVVSILLFAGLLYAETQTGVTLKQQIPRLVAFFKMNASGGILSGLGAVNILILPLIAGIYLIHWRKALAASRGAAPLRDLAAIFIFSAFTLVFFPRTGASPAMAAGLCTAMHTVYLLSAVGNFGGLGKGEKPRNVLNGLAVILALAVLGALPRFFRDGLDFSGMIITFFEMSLVYVLGFVAKIMFFADSMLTVSLKYNWMRAGFGLLAALILFPIVGFVLNFILYPAAALLSLPFSGSWPGISFTAFLNGVFSFITVPAVYLTCLARTNPLSLILLLLAVCYNVSTYPKLVEDRQAQRLPAGQGSFLLRLIAPFSLEPLKKGMIPVYLIGTAALVLSTLLMFGIGE